MAKTTADLLVERLIECHPGPARRSGGLRCVRLCKAPIFLPAQRVPFRYRLNQRRCAYRGGSSEGLT